LSPHDVGLELLENSIATGCALVGLILILAPVSGAHFNPAVTIVACADRHLSVRDGVWYAVAQVVGACAGTVVANVMFNEPAFEWSTRARSGGGLWVSEIIATIGLLLVIFSLARTDRHHVVPFAVGAWITGAYWFTSSTSFANPAVTVARTLTDTFAGIKPASAPMFIAMQLVGTACALALLAVLYPMPSAQPEHADA
ncbi:MAG TPA: aquaporin, partial [Acidimicrobiia bacterium]|nr:aquaporin [Acidimicrobiia bacterium]